MESSGSDLMVFFSAFVDARCDVPFSEGKRRMSSAKSFIITNKSCRAVTVKHLLYVSFHELKSCPKCL